jgi:hypothetical protein
LGFRGHHFGEIKISDRVGDIDKLQSCSRGEQRLEGEFGIQCGIPRGHASRKHSAHRKSGVKAVRVLLNEASGNGAAKRMAPRDRSLRVPNNQVEEVENGDLIGKPFVDGPTRRGIRGTGQRETTRKHEKPCDRVADVRCRVGTAGHHITVAVEK